MAKALLDFPWQLESILSPFSEAYSTFHNFERLCEDERLERVRFISEEEYCRLVEQPVRAGLNNTRRPVLQVLPRYQRDSFGKAQAMPESGPNDLSQNWQVALREEMGDLQDWRTPQIIACEARRDDWAPSIVGGRYNTEVRIKCDDECRTHDRVIAFLESYRAHHYARSDTDPWDLARTKPQNEERPCVLPKPPRLSNARLEDLERLLVSVRRDGWSAGGRYYFVPPHDWNPIQGTKSAWRNNGSFRRATASDHIHSGPIDSEGRVWSWDGNERHWDVQMVAGGYWKINQAGCLLGKVEA